MKKSRKILLGLFAMILISVISGKLIMGNMVRDILKIPVTTPVLPNVDDGQYIGEYSIEPVYAKVNLSVQDHQIKKVSILRHDNGLGSDAEAIVDDIVEKQTLDIDVVSGATVSSKCILKAVEHALENEKGKDSR